MFHTRLHVPIPTRKSLVPCSPLSHSMQHRLTLHGASGYTPRSIGSRSTLHRPTLHVASPQAPRSVNPPYSKSLFPPRVEGPSRPYSTSCPVCCDVIATCPRFPPAFRLLPEPSRAFRLLPALLLTFPRPFLFPSRPVCCDSIATCPRFPSAARAFLPPASRSALSSSFCPLPGLAAIQKKPSGIALGGLLFKNGGYLLSHGCAVPSARAGLTSLFGMGRGGTPPP